MFLWSICLECIFPSFYHETMFILIWSYASYSLHNNGSCFQIQFFSLRIFIRKLTLLMFRIINEQFLLISVILFVWCRYLPLFWYAFLRLVIFCVFLDVLTLFRLKFSLKILFILVLSMNAIFIHILQSEIFSLYSKWYWNVLSLTVCRKSTQVHLYFRICIEKAGTLFYMLLDIFLFQLLIFFFFLHIYCFDYYM